MSGSRGALAPEPEPIDLRSRPHRSPSVAVFEQDSDGEQHPTTTAITAAGDLQLEVEESPRWQANEKFQVQDGDASADQEGERDNIRRTRTRSTDKEEINQLARGELTVQAKVRHAFELPGSVDNKLSMLI